MEKVCTWKGIDQRGVWTDEAEISISLQHISSLQHVNSKYVMLVAETYLFEAADMVDTF